MARSMGGGGRSSSGGGGRSMGGSSRSSRLFSGSGRSRGTSSGGSTRRVGGSSYHSHTGYSSGYHSGGHHHCPPPPRHYHSRPRYYSGGPRYYSGGGSGCGCSTFFMLLIIIIVIASLVNLTGVKSTQSPTHVTSNQKLDKDKYEGAVCTKHGYYIDNSDPSKGGFIDRSNEGVLISGFKEFYNKTGVFPFLYIVETLPDGYSNAQEYSEYIYEELFSDDSGVIEGNLLILFVADEQYGEGDYYLTGGLNIGATIDDTAVDVICAEINSRWDSGNLGQIMGNGLKDAGKTIMAKSNARTFGVTIIIGLVVIILILILFKWWKSAKAQKNKEQEDLERVLNTPLETFGSESIDELSDKYK